MDQVACCHSHGPRDGPACGVCWCRPGVGERRRDGFVVIVSVATLPDRLDVHRDDDSRRPL